MGRTIYVVYGQGDEALIGMMDSRALATEAVEAHNCRVSVGHLALLHNDGSLPWICGVGHRHPTKAEWLACPEHSDGPVAESPH